MKKEYFDTRTASELSRMRKAPTPPGKRPLSAKAKRILKRHAERIATLYPDARLVAYHQDRERSRFDVCHAFDVVIRGKSHVLQIIRKD